MLTDKAKGFFHHLILEFAIRKNWDFEENLEDFFKDVDMTSMVYSTGGFDITEKDIFEASKGIVTEAFKDFWNAVKLKDTAKDSDTVLTSMHSGSSDYLFVKDVKDIQSLINSSVSS